MDTIIRRQQPSQIVKKSQEEKLEKPTNDSVPSSRQGSGKPQCLHCVYKQGRESTWQKNKVRWAGKSKKKKKGRRVRTSHGNVAIAKWHTVQPKVTGVVLFYPRWVEKPWLGFASLS